MSDITEVKAMVKIFQIKDSKGLLIGVEACYTLNVTRENSAAYCIMFNF